MIGSDRFSCSEAVPLVPDNMLGRKGSGYFTDDCVCNSLNCDEDGHEFDSGYSECSEESWSASISPPPASVCVDYVYFVLCPSVPPAISHQPVQYLEPPASTKPPRRLNRLIPAEKLIKWSLPPPMITDASMPGWDSMPYGLERFWQSAFAWFFHRFLVTDNHLWTLQPINNPPPVNQWSWHVVSYSAKVRFQCQYKHGWTSMKGRVMFWYRIRRQDDRILCESLFQLFGQQCSRCLDISQAFITPMWYHEEIENAVRYLSTEVAEKYYGGSKVQPPRRLRHGRPLNHHDPSRCQACREGICVVNRTTI